MAIGVDPQTKKATNIPLFSFGRPHMRVFHMSWMAFFLAFFGWFGIAPMMAVVRDDLQLSKAEIGNTVIASVAVTIVARLVVGWLCDRIGPRITYSGLLIVGSIPVMTIGLANSYESFLLFRLAIGIIGAAFGVELTMNNIAALYYHDRFGLGVGMAGLIAGLFGVMNLFARSLGGFLGDKVGIRFGLRGRTLFLGAVLLVEGIALAVFLRMDILPFAIGAMLLFSLFVQMSEGATFSVVPFINQKALGAVAGIVGAGGNAGAVAAGFLFRMESLSTEMALLYLGAIVTVASSLVLVVRFSPEREREERRVMERALGRGQLAVAPAYAKRVPMALYSEA